MSEKLIDNLNRSLLNALAGDPSVFFIGEDILDPYGGAFKVSRGLSTTFPDRVIGTPISELGIVGVGNGLALAGQKAIVEIMFGDFIFLAFDQIINFAAKAVTMFGTPMAHHLVIRCPVGGNRGYGPTHSQSVQKHFIGIPNLDLFEISPLHDNARQLPRLLNSGRPCILFENKVLYSQACRAPGRIDELFEFEYLDPESSVAHVYMEKETSGKPLIITTGGMVNACLQAAHDLFLEKEIEAQIVVPYKIYPFDVKPLERLLLECGSLYIVEESTAGGTWGAEVAAAINQTLRGRFKKTIHLIHSKDSIIPSSRHLEKEVLVQSQTIVDSIANS